MNSVYRSLSRITSSQWKWKATKSQPFSTCSRQNVEAREGNWPKPTELLFQPKVANSVKLIGKVSSPVLTGYSPDGKFWAATTLVQDSSFQIPLKFEGDLAHIAVTHLTTSSRIFAAGQLKADVINEKSEIQVMVDSINFLQGSSKTSEWTPEKKKKWRTTDPVKDGDGEINTWRSLLNNPKEWWDYRDSKLNGSVNPKFPDFKRKDDGHPIWLTTAPKWVLSELEGVEFDVKLTNSKQAKQQKGEESWKDLIENPKKWWDNRVDKKNVKAPDFKHKETGEGLWLDSSPTWVQSKLPPPKSGQQNAATSGGDAFMAIKW